MRKLAVLLLVFLSVAVASAAGPAEPLILLTSPAHEIVVQHLDGSGSATLSGGVGLVGGPAWSPDGTKVAFGTNRESSDHGPGEIYVVGADRSGLHAVTNAVPAGHERFDPAWSPDGSQIAYLESSTATGLPSADVWVAAVGGGTPRALTADGADRRSIAWQPNGPLLLTERISGSNTWSLWTIDTASGIQRHLSDVAAYHGVDPGSWSPDGTQIALVDTAGRPAVVAADGSGLRELSTVRVSGSPVWSPDGRSLAFDSTRILDGPSGRYGPPTLTDISVVNTATGVTRRLTGAFDDQLLGFQSYAPAWWPDGSRLLFRTDDPSAPVKQMNADGTCEVPLRAIKLALSRFTFQPGVAFDVGPSHCVDLRLRVAAATSPVAIGRPASMKLIVENDGNLPATGVTVTVSALGDAVTFLSGGALGTMAPGESRSLTAMLASRRIGNATAGAAVTANEPDPTPGDARAALVTSVLNCTAVGTWGADTLNGTPGRDRICGLPGPDRIEGGKGNDYLDAGSGDDTIVGGPGHDTILGRGGRDVIYARDGALDWIDCGTEYDIAIVDRVDHTSHCEKVLRR